MCDRPTKRFRAENPRSSTPLHRIYDTPPTCPVHIRKSTRSTSLSTTTTSASVERIAPGELVFFEDDDFPVAPLACRSLDFEGAIAGAAAAAETSGDDESRSAIQSSRGAGFALEAGVASLPLLRLSAASPRSSAQANSFAAGSFHPQQDDELAASAAWQTSAARFFQEIDQRTLHVAPF